jgi:hypothetical protein
MLVIAASVVIVGTQLNNVFASIGTCLSSAGTAASRTSLKIRCCEPRGAVDRVPRSDFETDGGLMIGRHRGQPRMKYLTSSHLGATNRLRRSACALIGVLTQWLAGAVVTVVQA